MRAPAQRWLVRLLVLAVAVTIVGIAFAWVNTVPEDENIALVPLPLSSEVSLRNIPDRWSRSELGLVGAEKAGQAYHLGFGAWVAKFPTCDTCVEDCLSKHLAYYKAIGEEGILRMADLELTDRRAFYNSPNWSDPDSVRKHSVIYHKEKEVVWRHKGHEQQQLGDEMYDALFGAPTNPSATVAANEFIKRYIAKRLQILADDMFMPWERNGGIDDDRQVNMVTCSFVTRMRWNAFGIWVHLSGNNATILRAQVDGLGRTTRIMKYIRRLAAEGEPFDPPVVAYINVMDFPCSVIHPYLNFFTKRGVKGILLPDDQVVSWKEKRKSIISEAVLRPFSERNNSLFFIGSPNNNQRMQMRDMLEGSEYRNQTDITIEVLEHRAFKHLLRPIADHSLYRYLLSIRGRTASSRDMSFQVMNSTIVRLEDDDFWFQWYHVLWEPYYHYLPLHPTNTTQQMCTIRRMLGKPESNTHGTRNVSAVVWEWSKAKRRLVGANANVSRRVYLSRSGSYAQNEQLAANMMQIGEAITQQVVDNYVRYILRRYGKMQRYVVDPDPVLYLKRMKSFVAKRHRNVQVIPDDGASIKYIFHKWLKRRWQQIKSCKDPEFAKKTNGTMKGCVAYV